MDLNEELTPRERIELRESVVAGLGRLRAARARRSRIVAGVAASALVAVVVTAVAFTTLQRPDRVTTPIETSSPAPSPSGSPSAATPAPSPSSAAPSPTPLASPTIAFGDNCVQSADLEELSSALQASASPVDRGVSPAVRTLGGLDCAWKLSDDTTVEMSALPSSIVPESYRQKYSVTVCEGYRYDGSGCRRALETGSTWILVTASSIIRPDNSADEQATRARLDAAIPVFGAAGGRAGSPAPAKRTAAWWNATTCDALAARIPLADILGTTTYEDGYPAGFGTDVSIDIGRDAGLGGVCRWYSNGDGGELKALIVNVYPGAAWDWDKIVAAAGANGGAAASVEVPGAVAAVTGLGAVRPTSHYLWATDGVNVLSVLEAPDVVSAAASVIAALGAAR